MSEVTHGDYPQKNGIVRIIIPIGVLISLLTLVGFLIFFSDQEPTPTKQEHQVVVQTFGLESVEYDTVKIACTPEDIALWESIDSCAWLLEHVRGDSVFIPYPASAKLKPVHPEKSPQDIYWDYCADGILWQSCGYCQATWPCPTGDSCLICYSCERDLKTGEQLELFDIQVRIIRDTVVCWKCERYIWESEQKEKKK